MESSSVGQIIKIHTKTKKLTNCRNLKNYTDKITKLKKNTDKCLFFSFCFVFISK